MFKHLLAAALSTLALAPQVFAAERLAAADFESTPCRHMLRSEIERVDHYLYFADREQALAAAGRVDAQTFEASVREAAVGAEQVLYLRYRALPTQAQVEADAKALQTFAAGLGGRFDHSGCASHLY